MKDPDFVDRREVEFEGAKINTTKWLQRTATDALLVIHDGTIVVEFYFREMRPTTRRLTWSLGKALLSLLVLQNTNLKLSAAIETYIPSLTYTAFAGATVQHVLHQQTGLAFQETPPDDHPETIDELTFGAKAFREASHEYARYERTTGILPLLPGESSADGLYDFLLRPSENARPHGR